MDLFKDINIYVGRKLVCQTSKLLVSSASPMLMKILSTLTYCDTCTESQSIIVVEEEEHVVSSVFSKLSKQSPSAGFTIIQGKQTINISCFTIIVQYSRSRQSCWSLQKTGILSHRHNQVRNKWPWQLIISNDLRQERPGPVQSGVHCLHQHQQ